MSSLRAGFMGRRSSSSKSEPPPKAAWFEAAFDTYCDPADGQIGPEGIEKLCAALGVEPTDVLVLVLACSLPACLLLACLHDSFPKSRSLDAGKIGFDDSRPFPLSLRQGHHVLHRPPCRL